VAGYYRVEQNPSLLDNGILEGDQSTVPRLLILEAREYKRLERTRDAGRDQPRNGA